MNAANSNKKWLGAILLMQVLILLTLWNAVPSISHVKADAIPDAGAQRDELIEQSKATNEKLDKIVAILSSGDLHVTVKTPDADKH